MTKAEAIARLKARESDLRALGVQSLSLFGSTARGEARANSDVDLAVQLDNLDRLTLFDFLAIKEAATTILGTQADLVSEPARKQRLQEEIDRDRVHVF